MTGDDTVNWLWGIGALVLVGSSLAARRLPLKQSAKMAAAWVAIFSAVFVLFLFRDEGRAVWDRATAELGGNGGETVGGTFRVPRADDGHFWVAASVNGVAARFLVDSGATYTTISSATARAAQVEPEGRFPVAIATANGTAFDMRATVASLRVGPIEQRAAPALIADGDDINMLGMSFLSSLKSWRVEGATLVLTPL